MLGRMKVDNVNIQFQDSSAAKSHCFIQTTVDSMNSLGDVQNPVMESSGNIKMDSLSCNGFLHSVSGTISCGSNAGEDMSTRMPNSNSCSSYDTASMNTTLKAEGDLRNKSNTPLDPAEETEENSNSPSDQTDLGAECNSDLESCEGEKDNSTEEIMEITLSDYNTDERDADVCNEHSYSSQSKDNKLSLTDETVANETTAGLPYSETGSVKVRKTGENSEASHHVSEVNSASNIDDIQHQIINSDVSQRCVVNTDVTHTYKTLETVKSAETTRKQLMDQGTSVERISGSSIQVFDEEQNVSTDSSMVSSTDIQQDQPSVPTAGKFNTLTVTNELETHVCVESSETDHGSEVEEVCLAIAVPSEVDPSNPENSVDKSGSESEHSSNKTIGLVTCSLHKHGELPSLEVKQNNEKVDCFSDVKKNDTVTDSANEDNTAVFLEKSEQANVILNSSASVLSDTIKHSSNANDSSCEENVTSELSASEFHLLHKEPEIKLSEKLSLIQSLSTTSLSTENQIEPLTNSVLISKVIDEQSKFLSVSLPRSSTLDVSACLKSISSSSLIPKTTENLTTIPSVSPVTLKPIEKQTEQLAVSLPLSWTAESFSLNKLTSKTAEKPMESPSTTSSISVIQDKSISFQSVLVNLPVPKTTEKPSESLLASSPASRMIVKLSGPLLARARASKTSEKPSDHIHTDKHEYLFMKKAPSVSKICTGQSQFELKSVSNCLNDESSHSNVLSASLSTSLTQMKDKTDNKHLKPNSVRPEPFEKMVDTISDTAKKIKSEPIDDGYEESYHNSLQNPDSIEQGKIKTEPSTVSDDGKSKDSSKSKSAAKPVTLLPKVPVAIVNRGSNSTSVVCSYLIPINSSIASSSYFHTLLKSTSNGKATVKKITLNPGAKNVKRKAQLLKPLSCKNTTAKPVSRVTSAVTLSTLTPTISCGSLEIPSTPADFKVKSLDISSISELVQRKNLESIYKPPVPPMNFKCAKKTCLCTECGDQFLLEASLRDHFQRCSMIIQYYCKSCMVKLLFTNKCSLLKHLRCHTKSSFLSKKALQISADNISVLSVLEGNMPKTEHPTMYVVNSVEPTKLKTLAPKINNPCPECGRETHLKISHHFGSLGVICNFKHMCKQCSMYLPTACSLRAHIRLHNYIQPFVCPECGMKFDDIVTFKTHVNVYCYHFGRIPVFVCPLCSVSVSKATRLEQHFVLEHKNIFYRDKKCMENFSTYEQYLDHRRTVHNGYPSTQQVRYYCQICKTTFLLKFLLTHMHSHMSMVKQNIPFGYCCITCRDENKVSKIFISKNNLQQHLELHKAGPSTHCSQCSEVLFTDAELREHTSKCHTPEAGNVCKYCSMPVNNMVIHHKHCEAKNIASMFPDDIVPYSSRKQKASSSQEFLSFLNALNQNACLSKYMFPESVREANPGQFVCKYCKADGYVSFKAFTKHITTHVRDGVLICNKCQRRNFMSLGEMKSHQIVCGLNLSFYQKVAAGKEFCCEECDTYFYDNAELHEHVKDEHAFHPCHLCGLTYSTGGDLEQHVNTIHRGKKSITLSCHLCRGRKGKGKTFVRRELYYNHMATVHGIAKPSDEDTDSKRKINMQESGSPLKKLKVSECDHYSCAKCDFSTEKSEEFSDHIAKHKKDSSSIQCPNCGLCFRVVPSLKGHLLLVHKVKDVDQFIVDKGIQVPEEEEDVDMYPQGPSTFTESQSKQPVTEHVSDNPRECCVCTRIFETEAEKNFHMRTHGMAFISSRRRQRPKPQPQSDEDEVDVVNIQPNGATKTPQKSPIANTQDNSKPSPISVAKRVKLSEKFKILQPANQPVVAIERIPAPEQPANQPVVAIERIPTPEQPANQPVVAIERIPTPEQPANQPVVAIERIPAPEQPANQPVVAIERIPAPEQPANQPVVAIERIPAPEQPANQPVVAIERIPAPEQPANQPVVAIERIPAPEQTASAAEQSDTDNK